MKTIPFLLLFACSILSAQQSTNQENTHSLGLLYDYFWIQDEDVNSFEKKHTYQTAFGLNFSFRKQKIGIDIGGFYSKDLVNPFGLYIENPPGSGNWILPNGDPAKNGFLSLFIKSNYFVDITKYFSLYGNLGAGPDFWFDTSHKNIRQTWINAYLGTGTRIHFLTHLSCSLEAYYKHVLLSDKKGGYNRYGNSMGIQVKLNFVFNQ